MSVLSRLFRTKNARREELRPLWHAIVATSRHEQWYREGGVADTIAGRFDMIVAILALTLLRLEDNPDISHAPALLTELFVEDMDWQLRENGVGDLVVGKHIGKLVSVLGGRLGAFRSAFKNTKTEADNTALETTIVRNITLAEGQNPAALATQLQMLHNRFANHDIAKLLAAELPS